MESLIPRAARPSGGSFRSVAGSLSLRKGAHRAAELALQFVTEQFAYFKSDKCRDLDHHLGDIHSFILGEFAVARRA
jgi:hypothetical protein